MHFFGDKSATVYGALIDISSGSVGVAIVASNPNETLPKIIYSSRTPMRATPSDEVQDGLDFRRAKEALLAAALTLSHEGIGALRAHAEDATISKLCITCSSPWAYTIARNVRYENNTPFKITKSVIEDIVKSAEDEILLHIQKRTSGKKQEFDVVEKATVDITINDYPVKNPFGLKGNAVTLSHIAGVIPHEIIANVEEIHTKLFQGADDLRSHTFMLVMYCVMRDIFPNIHSSCIIDITGEATEFGMVENNLLIENTFIPHGSDSLTRDACTTANSPSADMHTSLCSYGSDDFIKNKSLEASIQVYKTHIKEAIAGITEHRALPKDIIVTSQGPIIHAFKTIIAEAIQEVTGQEHTVITLDTKYTSEVSQGDGNDVYLAVSARFFHKLHGCAELDEDD